MRRLWSATSAATSASPPWPNSPAPWSAAGPHHPTMVRSEMRWWRVGVAVCGEQPVGPAQADQRGPGDEERRAAPPAANGDGDRAERPDGLHGQGHVGQHVASRCRVAVAGQVQAQHQCGSTGDGTVNTSRPGTSRGCQNSMVDPTETPTSVASLAGWIWVHQVAFLSAQLVGISHGRPRRHHPVGVPQPGSCLAAPQGPEPLAVPSRSPRAAPGRARA